MESAHSLLLAAVRGIPEIVLPVLLTEEGSGRVSISGTAAVARARDQFFAVTAGHVVWGTGAAPKVCGPQNAVALNEVVRVVDPTNPDARIDVAYSALSARQIELLEPAAAIDLELTLPDLRCEPDDVYIAVGYPASKSKYRQGAASLRVTRYHISLNGAPDAEYARLGLSRDTHFLLRYPRTEGRTIDGESAVGPHPLGMSGGLILRPRIDSSRPYGIDYDVVSVLTAYREGEGLLLSTRLVYVIESMRRRFPNVASSLPTSHRIDLQFRGHRP